MNNDDNKDGEDGVDDNDEKCDQNQVVLKDIL